MLLTKHFLTKNDCYKANRKIKVKGLMLHSTGANNPYISRYVQPDDGVIGKNKHGNHWNQTGISKCVHAFIGLDTNGIVRTYQTLPWDQQCWGAGGKANSTHIQVEICEDGLKDEEYFNKVYKKAVELFAYLALRYAIPVKSIVDHSEAHKLGIASNHGDVMHWFPKHGKSMKTFRRDVEIAMLGKPNPTPPQPTKPPVNTENYNDKINRLADEVIAGKHGSGDARKKSLGKDYDAVQNRVNEKLNSKPSKPKESNQQRINRLADEVMRGVHGSGRDRQRSLGKDYDAVQKEVNRRMR